MRYFTPLLPAGAIRHCQASSKSPYVCSEKRSSIKRGCGCAFRQPSSIVQASPGGFIFRGSCQWFMVTPSNSKTQPSCFSCEVSVFGGVCALTTKASAITAINKRIGPSLPHPPLLIRRIVAEPPSRFKRADSARLDHFHFNLAECAIVHLVRRRIGQQILIAQFNPDPRCYVGLFGRAAC